MSAIAIVAVRAAIRIGKTAADAFDQYAQEKPILIPNVERVRDNVGDKIAQAALDEPEFGRLLRDDPELSKLWKNNRPVDAAAGVALEAVAYRFRQRKLEARIAEASDETAYGILVTQWAHGKGPVSPWVRMVVAMADVALEYVAGNPQVLGIGSNGEKLVGAISDALSAAIPDATTRATLGPRDHFAERLAALALHAGLKTISEHPDLVLSEAHLKTLLQSALTPVINALDTDSVADQVKWRGVTDALVGPALSAALTTLAQNPTAFLGDKFNGERAAGVMVTGLLNAAADAGVRRVFTEEGLKAFGHAAIAAAAEHPEVVLGELIDSDLTNDLSASETLALNLFRSVTTALADRKPPYRNELGVAVAVAAIDALKKSSAALIKNGGDWNGVIVKATDVVLSGFATTLNDDASIRKTAFTHTTLVDVARVVFEQVARTPHLLAGDHPEALRIVAAISKAIAADKELLLTADDWTQIVAVAAQEAAINPGRLFGLNASSMSGQLATDLIARLLQAAAADTRNPDHGGAGPVMIGQTLREAVIITLHAASGNVKQAFAQKEKLGMLAVNLAQAVANDGLELGGKEWLSMFGALLPDVLQSGEIPNLDPVKIAALLAR